MYNMKTAIAKTAPEKRLEDGLQELAQQIAPGDIITIAAMEMVDTTTVRRYLKGNVAIAALGKSILANGRGLLLQRQHGVGARSRVWVECE